MPILDHMLLFFVDPTSNRSVFGKWQRFYRSKSANNSHVKKESDPPISYSPKQQSQLLVLSQSLSSKIGSCFLFFGNRNNIATEKGETGMQAYLFFQELWKLLKELSYIILKYELHFFLCCII